MILATCILASSLAFIDGSIVNVALPSIGAALKVGGGGLAWVVSAYLLPLSALLLIGGAAGDLYGRRRLLVAGVVLFALSSVLCAAAPSYAFLITGRILQGVGAAMLMPNSLAILGSSFTGEARGRAIGTWAAAGAAAGAIGPLVGGWLIGTVGWRAIFGVNLPLAIAAVFLALHYVPADLHDRRTPLDWTGAALIASGLAGLTWGLTIASAARGLDLRSGIALAAGATLIALYIGVERRKGACAMTPLAMFASHAFIALSLMTVLLYGALGGLMVLVPYVLIEAKAYTAVEAGAALLPLPVVIALSSRFMGALATRIGARIPLGVGPLIVAGGCLLAMRIASPGSYWTTTLPGLLVIALGMAGAVAPLTTAVLSSVDSQHNGVASGLNSALARTGGLVTTALSAAVLASHGAALVSAYRVAAVVAAGLSLAAAIVIVLLGRDIGRSTT